MILFYNVLLSVFALLLLPLILPVVLGRTKYRGRSLERLGLKTGQINSKLNLIRHRPIIWIHALSVGEVTSVLPLIKGIREDMESAIIVFSAATRSGREIAESLLSPYADQVLFSPFDLPFAVRRYLAAIQPDLFILVETDFWPNWLYQLSQQNIPIMLVNGRVSKKSFAAYTRFSFFFKPMFACFNLLSMQTADDRKRMIEFGIAAEKVVHFGNLKYDIPGTLARGTQPAFPLGIDPVIWVCGSTHSGEEKLLLAAFKEINAKNLFLILAPRNISRGDELVQLARSLGLEAHTRSDAASVENFENSNVLILDTFGELATWYGLARLAFIGGSLVAEGGHNPIEAAAQGIPTLFGPHMEDFSEIAHDLLACGGARTVKAETLADFAAAILLQNDRHTAMSKAARALVEQHQGGVEQHLRAIRKLLDQHR